MKATARKYFVRKIYGSAGEIVNARQEMSRGNKPYGIKYNFIEVEKERFLEEIEKDEMFCCIQTMSDKFVEVDKKNIDKLNI